MTVTLFSCMPHHYTDPVTTSTTHATFDITSSVAARSLNTSSSTSRIATLQPSSTERNSDTITLFVSRSLKVASYAKQLPGALDATDRIASIIVMASTPSTCLTTALMVAVVMNFLSVSMLTWLEKVGLRGS